MSIWNNFYFIEANSPTMEQIIFFHDHVIIVVILILSFISYILVFNFKNKNLCLNFFEGQLIEIFWTILPMFLLIFIALPRLRLLYLIEENYKPNLTIKVIGHQWYWSYEYRDLNKNFDSFILIEENLDKNIFRLLEVDNRFIVPVNLIRRILVTSRDVIHSWTIPSIGVKRDAIPGRLNQLNLYPIHLGLFFGQCSEICGANHRFIPIVIEVILLKDFLKNISLLSS